MTVGIIIAVLGLWIGVSPFGGWFVGGPPGAEATLAGIDGFGALWTLPVGGAILALCGLLLALGASGRSVGSVAGGVAALLTLCTLGACLTAPGTVVAEALGDQRDVLLPRDTAPIGVTDVAYWTLAAAALAVSLSLMVLARTRP